MLSEEVAAPFGKLGIKELEAWQVDLEIAIRVMLERTWKEIAAEPTFWMELSQAILIAPIVFSLLFVLTISNLTGSIRLRKSFHTMLVQFKDPLKPPYAPTNDRLL